LKDGCTPLHLAAEFGHEAVTKQLLAAHCNVDLQNNNGFTAVQTAERRKHAGIATLIRKKLQETTLIGSRVVIIGLVANPELNGRTCTAVSFDDAKGRYSIEIDDTSFMIKPCNLIPSEVLIISCESIGFKDAIVKTTDGETLDAMNRCESSRELTQSVFIGTLRNFNRIKKVGVFHQLCQENGKPWKDFCDDVLLYFAARCVLHGKPFPIVQVRQFDGSIESAKPRIAGVCRVLGRLLLCIP
jgi:hypothetical protein